MTPGERCLSCQAPAGATVYRRLPDGAWFDEGAGVWRHPDSGVAIGDAAYPPLNPHYLESVGRARVERVSTEKGLCTSCRDRHARASRRLRRMTPATPGQRHLL